MPFTVTCSDPSCGCVTWAKNIVDLIDNHTNTDGWFVCETCKKPSGYIEKNFTLQEGEEEVWAPYLRGVIKVNDDADAIYQPFIFLVSYDPKAPIEDYWFCYYKDMRSMPNGRLKMGHGPGGPPVLGKQNIVKMLKKMISIGCMSKLEIQSIL
jgi:hypothetical protein